ncbi:MAG: hypothetical protein IOC82_06715 [Aestuariivirga sp.]|uniref:hypothetical protein n=1 Tax=Aestuariivirga sp. TaxID=2650926 RepID=UPI0034574241|nr:hypothetical protein [Aestuariivirga sp.]
MAGSAPREAWPARPGSRRVRSAASFPAPCHVPPCQSRRLVSEVRMCGGKFLTFDCKHFNGFVES